MLVDWNPRAWKVARKNCNNAPEPPSDMSETEYASYIGERVCKVCKIVPHGFYGISFPLVL